MAETAPSPSTAGRKIFRDGAHFFDGALYVLDGPAEHLQRTPQLRCREHLQVPNEYLIAELTADCACRSCAIRLRLLLRLHHRSDSRLARCGISQGVCSRRDTSALSPRTAFDSSECPPHRAAQLLEPLPSCASRS